VRARLYISLRHSVTVHASVVHCAATFYGAIRARRQWPAPPRACPSPLTPSLPPPPSCPGLFPLDPGARCCWRGRRPVLPVLRALSGPALAGGIRTRDDNLNMRTSRPCFQNAALAPSRRARLQTQKVIRADILTDPNRYSNRSKHISKHINTYL
jgi:hypothetical protein